MYHLKNGVAQLRPDNRTLVAATPLLTKTPEQRPASDSTVLEYYTSVFASSVAERIDQRLDCFRTRFQVYCIDNAFEDPDDNPDGLDTDAYDSHSVHSLLTHRSTGNTIGTVRLVLPWTAARGARFPCSGSPARLPAMPWRRFRSRAPRDLALLDRQELPPAHARPGIEATLTPEEWRKMLFHLPLGLVRSCIEMSVREGITHCGDDGTGPAAPADPARHPFQSARAPGQSPWTAAAVLGRPGRMLRRVFDERPDVWDVITDGGRLWPLTEAHPVAARRAMAG